MGDENREIFIDDFKPTKTEAQKEARRIHDRAKYKENAEKRREYSNKYYHDNKERMKANAEEKRIRLGIPKRKPGRQRMYEPA